MSQSKSPKSFRRAVLLQACQEMLAELTKDRVGKLRYPDSDFMEYCPSCGRSPYATPQHDTGCLVVRAHALKAKLDSELKTED